MGLPDAKKVRVLRKIVNVRGEIGYNIINRLEYNIETKALLIRRK